MVQNKTMNGRVRVSVSCMNTPSPSSTVRDLRASRENAIDMHCCVAALAGDARRSTYRFPLALVGSRTYGIQRVRKVRKKQYNRHLIKLTWFVPSFTNLASKSPWIQPHSNIRYISRGIAVYFPIREITNSSLTLKFSQSLSPTTVRVSPRK